MYVNPNDLKFFNIRNIKKTYWIENDMYVESPRQFKILELRTDPLVLVGEDSIGNVVSFGTTELEDPLVHVCMEG